MNLIALLIGLLLEYQLTHLLHLRELRWFDPYFDAGLQRLEGLGELPALAGAAVLALLPVVPVAVVAVLFEDVLLGLPYLAFAVFMLLISLGPRNLYEEVEDYLTAARRGDESEVIRLAKELTEHEPPADSEARRRSVECAIYVQANNRTFGVIFWFAVLGPVGAWLFRVADLMRRRAIFESQRRASEADARVYYPRAVQRVHGALAWPSARLLALGYALAGSFEDAMSDWRAYYHDRADNFFDVNDDLLACTGCGALRGSATLQGADEAQTAKTAMGLVNRTLLVWLTAIALLTLAGHMV